MYFFQTFVYYLLAISVLLFIERVSSITVLIRSADQDWSQITHNEIKILSASKQYDLLCYSSDPVMFTTTAELNSFTIENLFERYQTTYKNRLRVMLSKTAAGNYTCYESLKSPLSTNASVFFQLFIEGPTEFLHGGESINLNQIEDTSSNIVPCRVSNAEIMPTLKINNSTFNATFLPTVGFVLNQSLQAFQEYECCLEANCVKYTTAKLSFFAMPNKSEISPLSGNSHYLRCGGDEKLKISIKPSNYTSFATIRVQDDKKETMTMSEKGYIIEINKITQDVQIECKDSKISHIWNINMPQIPPVVKNQSFLFWPQRSSFLCFSTDKDLKIRNLFCENKNNCDLKETCFQEDTCSHFVKYGVPSEDLTYSALRDPFNTGVAECFDGYESVRQQYFTGLNRQKYDVLDTNIPTRAMVRIEDFPRTYYRGLDEPLLLFCQHTLFTLSRGAFFQIKLENGTIQSIDETMIINDEDYEEIRKRFLRDVEAMAVKFIPKPGVAEVICSVPETGKTSYISDSRGIQVIDAVHPKIWNVEEQKVLYLSDDVPQHILCNATGQPPPSVGWVKKFGEDKWSVVSTSALLTMTYINDTVAGTYRCIAENKIGKDTLMLEILVKISDSSVKIIWIWIVVPVVFFLIVAFMALWVAFKRRTSQLQEYLNVITEKEINEFFKGNSDIFNRDSDKTSATDIASNMPYNNLYEISEDRLKFCDTDIIGKGEFGVVFKGTLNGSKTVAVKTVHKFPTKKIFTALLTEIKIMIYVGYHPNIVEFVGAMTRNFKQLEAFAIVEFCEQGDLHTFLDSLHGCDIISSNLYTNFLDKNAGNLYTNTFSDQLKANEVPIRTERAPIPFERMVEWCFQICSGVEHLQKRKIVHGDIATRNILLDGKLRAKLGDFGLSGKVDDYCEYVKQGQNNPLPWRWMAIESLFKQKFSFASDVWSVGVTFWEIFSLGDIPYPQMSWNNDFMEYLAGGSVLPCPKLCPPEVYQKLYETWNRSPKSRISIGDLKLFFENLLSNNSEVK